MSSYTVNGETYSSRKRGEGVVKWIDADNVIYERHWWRVESVHEASGRIRIYRIWLDDGVICTSRTGLPPAQSRLSARPVAKG